MNKTLVDDITRDFRKRLVNVMAKGETGKLTHEVNFFRGAPSEKVHIGFKETVKYGLGDRSKG